MKGKTFLALMIALLIGLLLIVMAQGCYSPKKAEKQVSKALAYYPEQTIGKVRILAPCFTIGSSFSTDSAAYKASIDSLYNTRGWYETLIRGLENYQHDTSEDVKCPSLLKAWQLEQKEKEYYQQYAIDVITQMEKIKPVIINHYDTTEDLAKVQEMDFKLLAQQKLYREQTAELSKVKQERDKAQGAKGTLIWWIVGLGISILLLLVLLYFILKGKATTKSI